LGAPRAGSARATRGRALRPVPAPAWEGALPRGVECGEACGVPRRIVSFILPLGYRFNLDGSTLYLSLAAVFVAQAAGVDLTVGQQMTIRPKLDIGSVTETVEVQGAPPPVVGFGISTPADVQCALACGARGVIVGSALVRRLHDEGAVPAAYLAELKAATVAAC